MGLLEIVGRRATRFSSTGVYSGQRLRGGHPLSCTRFKEPDLLDRASVLRNGAEEQTRTAYILLTKQAFNHMNFIGVVFRLLHEFRTEAVLFPEDRILPLGRKRAGDGVRTRGLHVGNVAHYRCATPAFTTSSRWRDLNPRSPEPHSGAIARLRYTSFVPDFAFTLSGFPA